MTAVATRTPPTVEEAIDRPTWATWLAALLIPIGPAAVAALRFLLPYDTTSSPSAMARGVAGHPGTQSAVLWLGLVATLTLVPGVIWVARLTRREAPGLTRAALILLVPGYLVLGWLVATDLMAWTAVHRGVDPATVGRLIGGLHPSALVADGIFVLGHVVGTVLLGLALWRTNAIPRWAAALVVASQPVHFVAAVILSNHPLDLFAWGANAAGFAVAAGVMVKRGDCLPM